MDDISLKMVYEQCLAARAENEKIVELLEKINENIKAIAFNTCGLSDCILPNGTYQRAHIRTREHD